MNRKMFFRNFTRSREFSLVSLQQQEGIKEGISTINNTLKQTKNNPSSILINGNSINLPSSLNPFISLGLDLIQETKVGGVTSTSFSQVFSSPVLQFDSPIEALDFSEYLKEKEGDYKIWFQQRFGKLNALTCKTLDKYVFLRFVAIEDENSSILTGVERTLCLLSDKSPRMFQTVNGSVRLTSEIGKTVYSNIELNNSQLFKHGTSIKELIEQSKMEQQTFLSKGIMARNLITSVFPNHEKMDAPPLCEVLFEEVDSSVMKATCKLSALLSKQDELVCSLVLAHDLGRLISKQETTITKKSSTLRKSFYNRQVIPKRTSLQSPPVPESARGVSSGLSKFTPNNTYSEYVNVVQKKVAAEYGWMDPRLTVP